MSAHHTPTPTPAKSVKEDKQEHHRFHETSEDGNSPDRAESIREKESENSHVKNSCASASGKRMGRLFGAHSFISLQAVNNMIEANTSKHEQKSHVDPADGLA